MKSTKDSVKIQKEFEHIIKKLRINKGGKRYAQSLWKT